MLKARFAHFGLLEKENFQEIGARSQARDGRFNVRLAFIEESYLKTQSKQTSAKIKTNQT